MMMHIPALTSIALVNGDITGAEGDSFTAGDMGDYEVVDAGDDGTEIILGAPFKFIQHRRVERRVLKYGKKRI